MSVRVTVRTAEEWAALPESAKQLYHANPERECENPECPGIDVDAGMYADDSPTATRATWFEDEGVLCPHCLREGEPI